MRKLYFGIFLATLLTTPAFAARCGGNFNAFIAELLRGSTSRRHLA